jgi:hypothetical protein
MDFWKFLNQNWIGSLIGLISIIIAVCIYRASRVGARPVYQRRALRLIGVKEQALPEEVSVLFKGKNVPRLTKTYIILWNSGKATIEGKAIVTDDPLRLEFNDGSEVLSAQVIKQTHTPNKFVVNINQQSTNVVFFNFEYLNTQDGVTLELLHTSPERYPQVKGSIKGIPKGISDWGAVSFQRIYRGFPNNIFTPKFSSIFGIIMGIFFVLLGVFEPIKTESSPPPDISAKWVFIGFGALFIATYSLFLWLRRRRFPKSLSLEDIE